MANKPTNIHEFKADLQKFSDLIGVTFEKVVRRVVLEVFEGVTRRTPVDTGRARASWFTNAGPSAGDRTIPDSNGEKVGFASENDSTAAEISRNTAANPFQKQWVYNNLPYIESLENGSSNQAPEGMVAVTVEEVEGRINTIIEDVEGRT